MLLAPSRCIEVLLHRLVLLCSFCCRCFPPPLRLLARRGLLLRLLLLLLLCQYPQLNSEECLLAHEAQQLWHAIHWNLQQQVL